MTNPFTEFFAKHAETLEAHNAQVEELTAEKAESVETYIENALSLDHDFDDLDNEDAYDFDPVIEDDEPSSGPRP